MIYNQGNSNQASELNQIRLQICRGRLQNGSENKPHAKARQTKNPPKINEKSTKNQLKINQKSTKNGP